MLIILSALVAHLPLHVTQILRHSGRHLLLDVIHCRLNGGVFVGQVRRQALFAHACNLRRDVTQYNNRNGMKFTKPFQAANSRVCLFRFGLYSEVEPNKTRTDLVLQVLFELRLLFLPPGVSSTRQRRLLLLPPGVSRAR